MYGENTAADFLEAQGCVIVERNYKTRYGEIDLIAKEEQCLLIVEVKSRKICRGFVPSQSVNYKKQRKICRTFDWYRMEHQLDSFLQTRFDVIEVYEDGSCRWIQNAYEYIEG